MHVDNLITRQIDKIKMAFCRKLFGRGCWNKAKKAVLLLIIFGASSYLFHNKAMFNVNYEEIPIYRNDRHILTNTTGNVTHKYELNRHTEIAGESVTPRAAADTGRLATSSIISAKITSNESGYIPEKYRGVDDPQYTFAKTIKAHGTGFTVITMFHLFTGQNVEGYDKETIDGLVTRNSEYLDVVHENVNHPQLKRLILLYTNETTMKVLLRQNWPNVTKVYPYKMDRMIHMTDFFNISSLYLIDEPVIGTNGDIVIGEGFDQIDTEKLRDTKTLYSLTRHGNKGLGECEAKSMCLMKYYGSHDTHIFRLKEPISEAVLKTLSYPVNLQQAENGMIGVMTLEAKFNVYNPCSILTTYHVHCSRIGTRYVRGHNSIRNDPWKVKKVKTSPPVKELRYGPPAPRAKPKPGQRAKKQ